ncbi:unnamed protein product [Prunus brigantina]
MGNCSKTVLSIYLVDAHIFVTEEEFTVAMEELVIVGSSKVKTFISDLSRDHYANAYFKGMRYGEMANSLAESFNNWVGVFEISGATFDRRIHRNDGIEFSTQ